MKLKEVLEKIHGEELITIEGLYSIDPIVFRTEVRYVDKDNIFKYLDCNVVGIKIRHYYNEMRAILIMIEEKENEL